MLTIGAAFYRLRDGLIPLYGPDEAAAIGHEAIGHITGQGRLERLVRKNDPLGDEELLRFVNAEKALLQGVPLQYVTGQAYFLGRAFAVSPAVLIPRPETEELVQWITADGQPRQVLDIGTGSGCIAISLKLELPDAQILGIDISEDALEVARANARALDAAVRLEQLDILMQEAKDALPAFDVIVSNPPYIPASERDSLHTNVRDHEPGHALFVPGHDALLFYRVIADLGLTHLTIGGSIYCELHRDYASDAVALFEGFGYRDVSLRNDMHNAPRMLRARR